MNDRAFRLDFFIAIAALVVSILTTGTLVYQTHVIEEQYSSAIWPYLGLNTTTNPSSVEVSLANNGLGPALIRSAQLTIDGRLASSWTPLVTVVHQDAASAVHRKRVPIVSSVGSMDRSTAIRPGENYHMYSIFLPKDVPLTAITRHKVSIDLCYCSLNGHCWRLIASPGVSNGATPQDATSCPDGPHINAS
jgi:hypothetical protein